MSMSLSNNTLQLRLQHWIITCCPSESRRILQVATTSCFVGTWSIQGFVIPTRDTVWYSLSRYCTVELYTSWFNDPKTIEGKSACCKSKQWLYMFRKTIYNCCLKRTFPVSLFFALSFFFLSFLKIVHTLYWSRQQGKLHLYHGR